MEPGVNIHSHMHRRVANAIWDSNSGDLPEERFFC